MTEQIDREKIEDLLYDLKVRRGEFKLKAQSWEPGCGKARIRAEEINYTIKRLEDILHGTSYPTNHIQIGD